MADNYPTPETDPITAYDIMRGFMLGLVHIGRDHYGRDDETVCHIGANWFYFGGLDAERESPYEYVTNHDFGEIVDDIVVAVNSLAVPYDDGIPRCEWLACRYLLSNKEA